MFACEITIINLSKKSFSAAEVCPTQWHRKTFQRSNQSLSYTHSTHQNNKFKINSKWPQKEMVLTCSYLFLTRRLECRMEHRLSWFVSQSGVNIATGADKWLNQSGYSYIHRYQWEGIRNVATKLSNNKLRYLIQIFPESLKSRVDWFCLLITLKPSSIWM